MSEYQRYEFMTVDQPLATDQLKKVKALSSHIEASATHAIVEYNWGDFKHDPIKVLGEYFDGFLYWANWGTPQLAFRFPHGVFTVDNFDDYDFEDFVEFVRGPKYDILDIHFNEMEGWDEWVEYELGSLIAIRDELMEGDLRSLYIVWLAAQSAMRGYDEEEEGEDYDIALPPVPAEFGKLTAAQKVLAELLQVSPALLEAAARHSVKGMVASTVDLAEQIKKLPFERAQDYLLRLAKNEAGLSRRLLNELRDLNKGGSDVVSPVGEKVAFATLCAERE